MHSSLAIPNHSHAVRLCCFNMTCVLPCVFSICTRCDVFFPVSRVPGGGVPRSLPAQAPCGFQRHPRLSPQGNQPANIPSFIHIFAHTERNTSSCEGKFSLCPLCMQHSIYSIQGVFQIQNVSVLGMGMSTVKLNMLY